VITCVCSLSAFIYLPNRLFNGSVTPPQQLGQEQQVQRALQQEAALVQQPEEAWVLQAWVQLRHLRRCQMSSAILG